MEVWGCGAVEVWGCGAEEVMGVLGHVVLSLAVTSSSTCIHSHVCSFFMEHKAQSTEHEAGEGPCSVHCHLVTMLGIFMLLVVTHCPHIEVRASTEFIDHILSFF